jgi:glucan-binding YG repeat protein
MPMLYEWFSHWSLASDGTRLYDGRSLEAEPVKPADQPDNNKNSGNGGGGRGRGNSSRAEYSKGYRSDNRDGGDWRMDARGWWFRNSDGTYPQGMWKQLTWNGQNKWYHFDAQGYCNGGWLNDSDGNTYFLYDQHDGNFGYMLTGWQLIEGKWYYFEPEAGKMQGHLYRNTTTPDGYRVDANGVWIQ